MLAEKNIEETAARLEGIDERYDVAEQETQRSLGWNTTKIEEQIVDNLHLL